MTAIELLWLVATPLSTGLAYGMGYVLGRHLEKSAAQRDRADEIEKLFDDINSHLADGGVLNVEVGGHVVGRGGGAE